MPEIKKTALNSDLLFMPKGEPEQLFKYYSWAYITRKYILRPKVLHTKIGPLYLCPWSEDKWPNMESCRAHDYNGLCLPDASASCGLDYCP
jgi:hypothetical protein